MYMYFPLCVCMCMSVYMCECMRVGIHVHGCASVYVRVDVCFLYSGVYLNLYVHLCMHVIEEKSNDCHQYVNSGKKGKQLLRHWKIAEGFPF